MARKLNHRKSAKVPISPARQAAKRRAREVEKAVIHQGVEAAETLKESKARE